MNIFARLAFESQSLVGVVARQFATKMQASSTQNTKDSAGRRLGVKKLGGEEVFPMDIVVRQRGAKYKPGANTFMGKDHTIHAKLEGKVEFVKDSFQHKKYWTVNVVRNANANRQMLPPPPYCYHPELFPELAKNNPTPTNLRVYKTQVPVDKSRDDRGALAPQQPASTPNAHSQLIQLLTLQRQRQLAAAAQTAEQ